MVYEPLRGLVSQSTNTNRVTAVVYIQVTFQTSQERKRVFDVRSAGFAFDHELIHLLFISRTLHHFTYS